MTKTKRKKSHKWPICLAAAFFTVTVGMIFWQKGTFTESLPTPSPLPAHSYDWSLLFTDENGRRQYTFPDGTKAKVGIDVSSHQGTIDWTAVAQDGIEFAFVRVGSRGYESGKIYADEKLAENLQGAIGAGIPTGVYFYSQAVTEDEAREEAEYLLSVIEGYSLDLPVVLDYEEVLKDSARTLNLSNQQRTDNAVAFCETIQAAGYRVMVYSTRSMLLNHFDLARLEQYPIWVAEFNEITAFPYAFSVWQYTDRGRVAGIGPDVDLNLMFQ